MRYVVLFDSVGASSDGARFVRGDEVDAEDLVSLGVERLLELGAVAEITPEPEPEPVQEPDAPETGEPELVPEEVVEIPAPPVEEAAEVVEIPAPPVEEAAEVVEIPAPPQPSRSRKAAGS